VIKGELEQKREKAQRITSLARPFPQTLAPIHPAIPRHRGGAKLGGSRGRVKPMSERLAPKCSQQEGRRLNLLVKRAPLSLVAPTTSATISLSQREITLLGCVAIHLGHEQMDPGLGITKSRHTLDLQWRNKRCCALTHCSSMRLQIVAVVRCSTTRKAQVTDICSLSYL
jgi:hypothetical protein